MTQHSSKRTADFKPLVTAEQVERYYVLLQESKKIEKEIQQLKQELHASLDQMVGENEKGSFVIGEHQVQRQIRTSVQYDQEKTVQRLDELQLLDCIDTVRKPNTSKIEAAMTLGLLSEQCLADCKDTKITQAIVVRKV